MEWGHSEGEQASASDALSHLHIPTPMHTAFLGLARLLDGPPLTGPRLVIPIPVVVAGPGARVEVGLQNGWLAVRLVAPALRPEPHVVDPDGDLGPHDAWAKF